MAVERQELYPEAAGGKVYVAGGLLNPNTGASAHFDAYDPVADEWTQLATLPDARHHIGLAATGGRIYGVGGFTGGFPSWRAQADTYVYSIADDTWSAGPALPAPRAEFVIESVGDRVYVIGGRVRATPDAGSFTAHVDSRANEVLDPATGAWRALAPAPTARNSAASAVVDGKIYVLGGRRFSLHPDGTPRQDNVATVEVFDPRTGRWQTRAPMPAPRGGLAAAVHDGQIYAFGGELQGPSPAVYGDVWRYDPRQDRWTGVGALPTPRHGLGAATVGDTVYTFGGGTRAGGNYATDLTEALVLG
ncbi:Kelch repeat-containing protein [Catenuloplanes indicus]|uniref:N-acetylneuraminic acid mutarotase n=1 Tax=Catenuloplanes indicus TaxID=137267 RepID=A0AAE4B0U6_9ACTN|nr:kelch repeat-containing protein [Catenuloplanes indicus]MDQ0369949.1 N-acetylneuraminic acid mutarotase [Catenuloplanes indicus]